MLSACFSLIGGPSFPCQSCARASAKVTARIVKMFQDGEINSGLAMQLLGGALSKDGGDRSKKRPLDGDTGHDASKAAKTDDGNDSDADGPSVDELLDQAKKVKNESELISNIFGVHFRVWRYIYNIYIFKTPTAD